MTNVQLWGLVVLLGLSGFVLGQTVPDKNYEILIRVSKDRYQGRANVEVIRTSYPVLDRKHKIVEVIDALQKGRKSLFFSYNDEIAEIVSKFFGFPKTDFVTDIEEREPLRNIPPVINCPNNIVKTQDFGRKSAAVTWQLPKAYDHEDGDLSGRVIIKSMNADPGSRFWEGTHPITYEVTDNFGANSQCTFTVTITVVKCNVPPIDSNMFLGCDVVKFLGEKCTFQCNTGYKLEGASVVTCTSYNQYSPPVPKCKSILCADPPLPDGGLKYKCNQGIEYDSRCTLECKHGYRINGANRGPWEIASTTCQSDGSWTKIPVCEDFTRPTFSSCPGTQYLFADRGSESTTAKWELPVVLDNSGVAPTVKHVAGPANGSNITKGAHQVTYEAIDKSGNKDQCSFFVNVEVRKCNPPKPYHRRMSHSCDQGFMYGSTCNMTCSLDIQLEGSNQITCELDNGTVHWREPNGAPTCLEQDCTKPRIPPNGDFYCVEVADGKACSLVCNDGYATARNTLPNVTKCSPATGKWSIPDNPGCVKPVNSTGLIMKQMFYWKYSCNDGDNLSEVNQEMTKYLSDAKFYQHCKPAICKIQNIKTTCKMSKTSGNRFIVTMWENAYHLLPGETVQLASSHLDVVSNTQMPALTRDFHNLKVPGSSTYTIRGRPGKKSVICDDYLSPVGTKCAACGDGYFWNSNECILCPENTYQDGTDSLRCTPCKGGFFTTGTGKYKASDCKAPCKAGSYSPTGLEPCTSCERNTFQDYSKSTQCNHCNAGQVTKTKGSTSRLECYQPSERVQGLKVDSNGDTYIDISWTSPSETYTTLKEYKVVSNPEGNSSAQSVSMVDFNTTSVNITDLQSDTVYKVKVYPVTESGPGLVASLSAKTGGDTEKKVKNDTNVCPAGTETPGWPRCLPCRVGFYQDQTNQPSCKVCGSGLSTFYEGSTSINDCVDAKLTPPPTTTTTTTTTTTAPQLPDQEPCGPGAVSTNGFKPGCRRCRAGLQRPDPTRTYCVWT